MHLIYILKSCAYDEVRVFAENRTMTKDDTYGYNFFFFFFQYPIRIYVSVLTEIARLGIRFIDCEKNVFTAIRKLN